MPHDPSSRPATPSLQFPPPLEFMCQFLSPLHIVTSPKIFFVARTASARSYEPVGSFPNFSPFLASSFSLPGTLKEVIAASLTSCPYRNSDFFRIIFSFFLFLLELFPRIDESSGRTDYSLRKSPIPSWRCPYGMSLLAPPPWRGTPATPQRQG